MVLCPGFEGGEPRSRDETRFLERLRLQAALWPSLGIRQQDTDVLTVLTPLYVGICLPELPSDQPCTGASRPELVRRGPLIR